MAPQPATVFARGRHGARIAVLLNDVSVGVLHLEANAIREPEDNRG